MEDDFFIRPYKVMKQFFQDYAKEISLPIWGYMHPKFRSDHPDILDLALESGLINLNLPIQCADQEINKMFGRNTDLAFISRCAFYVTSRFVPFNTHFIDGFMMDGMDDEEYLSKNLQFIKNLPAFHAGFPNLIGYSISFLRLHLNSPLLLTGKTRSMPCITFFHRAMLMLFRHILNDEEFNALEANHFYRQNPESLLQLYNQRKTEMHQTYMLSEARRLAGHEVFIWGGGGIYAMRKSLLAGLRPRAIVTDIPVAARRIDGLPVLPLQKLLANEERLPIIICTQNPQPLARKLKEMCPDYPHENIIGFGA